MKYLRKFRESKEDVEELINTYLAYIKDYFNIDIVHYPSKNIYSININKGKAFQWSDVADDIIPLIQYIKTLDNYKIEEINIRDWDSNWKGSNDIEELNIEELENIQTENILNIKIRLKEI
jgi:hypothetical protein